MRDGITSLQIADARRTEIMAAPPREVREAVCTAGCAFCCVLTDEDGGTTPAAEARRVHDATIPFRDRPDGRAWMLLACPAHDPATRLCRIYGARPSVCRSYYSTNVGACEINAKGGEADGSGALESHVDYLLVLALSRASLNGVSEVHTFSLGEVAAAALSGRPVEDGQHPDARWMQCFGAGPPAQSRTSDLRQIWVVPHVASKSRLSAIDGRTTRHPGYTISRKRRQKNEEPFGRAKIVGSMARTMLRGTERLGAQFTMTMAACNLGRLPKLLAT